MKVEIEGNAIVGYIDVEAPMEAVFEALTDPEQLPMWWGSDELYRTFNWQIDLRAGGAWSCEARNAGGASMTVRGVYLEVDPPRRLAYTWDPSWTSIPPTNVRMTLEPIATGTRVHLEHTGFPSEFAGERDGHRDGWERVLGWLGAYNFGSINFG